MLDGQLGAGEVEGVLAGRLLVPGGKAVSKLRAIVGEQFKVLDRRGKRERTQEIDAAFLTLILVYTLEHPARGAVDGHK